MTDTMEAPLAKRERPRRKHTPSGAPHGLAHHLSDLGFSCSSMATVHSESAL